MKIPGAIRTGVQSLGRHDTSAAGNVGGALAQAVGGLAKEANIWMEATRDSEEAEALADLKLRENQARTNHTSLLRDVPGSSMGKGIAGGSKIRADGTYRSYDVGTSMYGGAMDGHISETTKGLTFPQTKRFANAVRRLRTIGHDKVTAYHLKARHAALKTTDDLGVEKTIAGSNPDTIIDDAMIIAEVYERSAKNGVISIAEAEAKTLKATQILHFNVADRTLMSISEDVLAQRISPEEARARAIDVSQASQASAVLTDADKIKLRKRSVMVRKSAATAYDKINKQRIAATADDKVADVRERFPDSKAKQRAAIDAIADQATKDEARKRWDAQNADDTYVAKQQETETFRVTSKLIQAHLANGSQSKAYDAIPIDATPKQRKAYEAVIKTFDTHPDDPAKKITVNNAQAYDRKTFLGYDFDSPEMLRDFSKQTREAYKKEQAFQRKQGRSGMDETRRLISRKTRAMGLKPAKAADAKDIDVYTSVVMDRIRLAKEQNNVTFLPAVDVETIVSDTAKEFSRERLGGWFFDTEENAKYVIDEYQDAGLDYRAVAARLSAKAKRGTVVTPKDMLNLLHNEDAMKELMK